jgi:hypothetical protein
MGRIRSLHPEMLRDKILASLSDRAWRTYQALLCAADDEGYLEDHAGLILADGYPRGGRTVTEVEDDLREMAKTGAICRFVRDDVTILHVLRFSRWQHPQKPRSNDLPRCPEHAPEQGTLFGRSETTVPVDDQSATDTQPVSLGGEGSRNRRGGDASPLTRRAQAITDVIYAKDKLINYPAVLKIVTRALRADQDDETVTQALLALVAENRPIMQDTLRVQLGRQGQNNGSRGEADPGWV